MARFIIITIMAVSLFGCVRVKTDLGFMGPNVYYATDGKTEVRYYNGQCCCVAKKVLESLADRANSGELDWSKMADIEFQDYQLKQQCAIEQILAYGYWKAVIKKYGPEDYSRH